QRDRIRGDQIVDVENVSYLFAVAINNHGTPRDGAAAKPGEPSLILHPELPRPINAGVAKNQRSHAVNACVIEHIVVACALGTAIRRVRIERPLLRYSA